MNSSEKLSSSLKYIHWLDNYNNALNVPNYLLVTQHKPKVYLLNSS